MRYYKDKAKSITIYCFQIDSTVSLYSRFYLAFTPSSTLPDTKNNLTVLSAALLKLIRPPIRFYILRILMQSSNPTIIKHVPTAAIRALKFVSCAADLLTDSFSSFHDSWV